ncbi:MAG: hypothetical protein ACR2QF_09320 [Geminicoccaceae bacterium]
MSASDITDLIGRLEEATEAEQGDLLIEAAVRAGQRGWITESQRWRASALIHIGAFIDAALMLVPENADWIVSRVTDLSQMRIGFTGVIETLQGQGEVDRPFRMEHKAHAVAATPALALASAALKARVSEME